MRGFFWCSGHKLNPGRHPGHMYDLLNVEKMLTKPKKNKCFKDSSVLNGRTHYWLALIPCIRPLLHLGFNQAAFLNNRARKPFIFHFSLIFEWARFSLWRPPSADLRRARFVPRADLALGLQIPKDFVNHMYDLSLIRIFLFSGRNQTRSKWKYF